MSSAYWTDGPATLDRDAAAPLFPLGQLPADAVLRDRTAQVALDATPAERVLPVAPTGFASALQLGQHRRTLVRVAALPAATVTAIEAASGRSLDDVTFVQVGDVDWSGGNRSLTEFVDG